MEENPPSEGSRRAVDLTALDTFVEFKRRIGNGIEPNAEYVERLDDYLAASASAQNGGRMGILTDGKHWVLRWAIAPKQVDTSRPYAFTLPDADRWFLLYEWFRDQALVAHSRCTMAQFAVELKKQALFTESERSIGENYQI